MRWNSCTKNPPAPFVRTEIKDKNNNTFIGYYANFGLFLKTEGHAVIKEPNVWRYVSKKDCKTPFIFY